MTLQGDGFGIFTSRCGRFGNDQVSELISDIIQAALFGKVLQIVADCLRVEGAVGNR